MWLSALLAFGLIKLNVQDAIKIARAAMALLSINVSNAILTSSLMKENACTNVERWNTETEEPIIANGAILLASNAGVQLNTDAFPAKQVNTTMIINVGLTHALPQLIYQSQSWDCVNRVSLAASIALLPNFAIFVPQAYISTKVGAMTNVLAT